MWCTWKVTCKNGIQISINQVSPTDSNEWCPAIIPNTKSAKQAQKNGVHVSQLVSHSGWEMVLKIDPDGMYNERDYCFKIEKIIDATGRKVSVKSSNGRSDFYTLAGSECYVRGYSTGCAGDKFFFIAPTNEQKACGDIADHHKNSCKFYITVSIHKKQMREQTIYRGATRGLTRGISKSEDFNGGAVSL